MLCRFQEGGVSVGADVRRCLLVLAVFAAGVTDKRLYDLVAVIFLTAPAGDMALGQAA